MPQPCDEKDKKKRKNGNGYEEKKKWEIHEFKKLTNNFKRKFPHIKFFIDEALCFVIYQGHRWFRCSCFVVSDRVNFDEYYVVDTGVGDDLTTRSNVETFVKIFDLFEEFEKS